MFRHNGVKWSLEERKRRVLVIMNNTESFASHNAAQHFKGGPACDLRQNLPTLKNKRRYLFRTQRDLTLSLELSAPQSLSSNDAISKRSSVATRLHERKVRCRPGISLHQGAQFLLRLSTR